MQKNNANENKPRIEYLLTNAELQDSLLQNYRQMHLVIQSIFIAIGVGLSLSIISFDMLIHSLFSFIILVIFSVISFILLNKSQVLKVFKLIIFKNISNISRCFLWCFFGSSK